MPGSRPSSTESRFLSLSGDLLWNILSRIETSDLASVSCTCRYLDQIASSNEIWSRLCWQRWRSPNFSLIGLDKQSITQAAVATAEGNINRQPLITCKTCAELEKCAISNAASTSRGTYRTTSPRVICTESHQTNFTAPKVSNDTRSRETKCTAVHGTTGSRSRATTCTTSKVPLGAGLRETSCKDPPGTHRTGSIGSSSTEFMLPQEAPHKAACRPTLTCDVSHDQRREHERIRVQDSSLPERTAFNSPKQELGSIRTPDMQHAAFNSPKQELGSTRTPDMQDIAFNCPKQELGSTRTPDMHNTTFNSPKQELGSTTTSDMQRTAFNSPKQELGSTTTPDMQRTTFNSPKQELGSTRIPDMQPESTSFKSEDTAGGHAALHSMDMLAVGHPTSHCMDTLAEGHPTSRCVDMLAGVENTHGIGQGGDVSCSWDVACASDVGHVVGVVKDAVKVSDVKDADNVGNVRDAADVRLVRDVQHVKDAEHVRDVRDAKDIRLVRHVKDVKDAVNVRNVRDAQDIRVVRDVRHVKNAENVRDVRGAQDIRLVRDVKDVKDAQHVRDVPRDVGVVKDADDVVDVRDVKDISAARDVGQVIDAVVVGMITEDADINVRNAVDVAAARNVGQVKDAVAVGNINIQVDFSVRNTTDVGALRVVGNVGYARNGTEVVSDAGGSRNTVNAGDVGTVAGDRDADDERHLKDDYIVGDVRNSVDAMDVRDAGAKKLFCSSNGWHNAGLTLRELKPDGDFVCALHCRQLPEGSLSIACAKSSTLEVWNLKPWSGASSCSHHGNEDDTHVTCEVPQDHFSVYSVVQHAPGRFIAGNSIGSLLFFELDNSTLSHVHTHSLPIPTSPIVDLYVNPTSSHLASLHDSTFCMSPVDSPRNCLKWFDVNTCTELGRFTDCMDSYEVMCMCPSRGASGGMQLVAGSVHGEFCVGCYKSGIPSLCQHKPQAQSAALCVFDLRAQCAMVQRYSLHQRSLYPLMRSARDHYLFTSHAGQPLGVWDRRWMSMPVFAQEHLGNFPMPHVAQGLPLPGPSRPSAHQGLWLDCDDDILIGRAENGASTAPAMETPSSPNSTGSVLVPAPNGLERTLH